MDRTYFISGYRKRLIEFWIILRLYSKGISQFGFRAFLKEIKKYRNDNRNVFVDIPNRFLKNGKNIYVLPDVPPVNKSDFIDYLLKDIASINNNKPYPLLFTLFCISSRCPYKCPYCYNSSEHTTNEILSVEIIKKTISELISKGVKNIYLSGGEPMMRWNEIPEILESFDTSNIGFWILTTGWEIDEEKIKVLKKIGIRGLMVSLDSLNREDIAATKGERAFDIALNAIRLANKEGLMVAIDAVFGRNLLNEDRFYSFINFAGELGAHFINCYSPRQISEELNIDKKQFGSEEFAKLKELTNSNLTSKKFKDLPLSYSPDIWEAKRGCVGGKLFIYISPTGAVKTCPFNKIEYGNICNEPITNILENISKSSIIEICKSNEILKEELSLIH